MVRYFDGVVPEPCGEPSTADRSLLTACKGLGAGVQGALEQVALQDVLVHIWELVEEANKYVQATAPWELAKERGSGSESAEKRLRTVLYNLVDTLRILGYAVWPVIPAKAEELTSSTASAWSAFSFRTVISRSKPARSSSRPVVSIS